MEDSMPEIFLWDFFIAHSHEDKENAHELYSHLKLNSKVFLDEECLLPGSEWDLGLLNAQKASAITIILVSEKIHSSYYAREEITLGIQLSIRDPNRRLVIPIYIKGFKPDSTDMYYGLRLKQGLDVNKEGGLENVSKKLLVSISNLKSGITSSNYNLHNSTPHILLQYPAGPAVNAEIVRRPIIDSFAALIRRIEARIVIAEANAFRKEANPNDENVTVIDFNYILPEDTVNPFAFWVEVFNEARLNGPRMLAALILTVPPDKFSAQAQSVRSKILEQLQQFKS